MLWFFIEGVYRGNKNKGKRIISRSDKIMDLIGIKVKHKAFGVGTVTEQDAQYITIAFEAKTTKFLFPGCFENFVKAEDAPIQIAIDKIITEGKIAAEQKKQEKEAARKAAEEKKKAEDALKREVIARKTSYKPKEAIRTIRVEGKNMIFFVFQGNTFERECEGGYIWAPVYDKSGSQPHHWARLEDVRKGDIILHGCDAHIKAISVAKDACYSAAQPEELQSEDLWEQNGRRVDCEYIRINNPIKTSTFREDIVRLCQAKYSPFDKDGNGNMGYLYEINRELAHIFVEASAKLNPYIESEKCISEFLAEEFNG